MIPKFSIRQLLLMMIAVGVISACMAGASRGNRVAFGLSVAIIGTIVPLTVYALVHWVGFLLATIPVAFNSANRKSSADSTQAAIQPITVASDHVADPMGVADE